MQLVFFLFVSWKNLLCYICLQCKLPVAFSFHRIFLFQSLFSYLNILAILSFFSPLIGNADGMGNIRKEELYRASAVLKVICNAQPYIFLLFLFSSSFWVSWELLKSDFLSFYILIISNCFRHLSNKFLLTFNKSRWSIGYC